MPDRSRVTVSQPAETKLAWGGDGCMNGRTQYAEDGRGGWQRVLVPDEEATVSILAYQPATRTYTNTRYFLDEARMAEARRLREGVSIKACSTDGAGARQPGQPAGRDPRRAAAGAEREAGVCVQAGGMSTMRSPRPRRSTCDDR